MPKAKLTLETVVICVYAALDDALVDRGIKCREGKLIPRPGPTPEVDDREVLCLAVLQELLGFDSDNSFYDWLTGNQTMKALFPRQLSRQNWADRRALLTPLMQGLTMATSQTDVAGSPPFRSLIRTP